MSGLLIAGIATGCGAESSPTPPSTLELTANKAAYPYNPNEVGEKGTGKLGTADSPLKYGEKVVAACLIHNESDPNGSADAVRIDIGRFAGSVVPLETYLITDDHVSEQPESTFTLSADQIRGRIDPC